MPDEHTWFHAKNSEATLAPSQGIAVISGVESGEKKLTIAQASQSGFANVVYIGEDIAPGMPGRVYLTGNHRFTVRLQNGETLAKGGRVGCRKDSWYAQPDTLGPIQVDQVYDASGNPQSSVTNSTGADLDIEADARFLGRRGDHVIVDGTAQGITGPFQTIIWGSNYTVAQDSPGLISIERA